MWLTQGHQFYAAFSQSGIQKFINNVFAARPHYFNYATASLAGGSASVSLLSPISVPNTNAGIDYKFQFPSAPVIQLYPNPVAPPPQPLPTPPIPPLPNPYAWSLNQFVIYATLNVYALQPPNNLIGGNLQLWAFGHPQLNATATISLVVDNIEVSDAGTIGPIIAYVGKLMLNGLLDNLQFSADSIGQGAFEFKLEAGPSISSQQLQIWGSIA